MNIFKILANGDGRINEANISAFIGYLLNPYEDHGLGHEFLSRFLIINLGNESYEIESIEQYEFEILFEQAFYSKLTEKKQIVDIVILCFLNTPKKGENIVHNLLTNKMQLNEIILIENKINDKSAIEGQLSHQFKNTKSKLDEMKELMPNFDLLKGIKTIYITPSKPFKTKNNNINVFEEEFLNFQTENDVDKINSNHIKWKSDASEDSLQSILKSIIIDEFKGKIEAINAYTKHTIISFIKYIDNDFKSSFEIRREGKFQKEIFYSLSDYFNKCENNLNYSSNNLLTEFNKYLISNFQDKYTFRHSKTHPLSVFIINGSKFFSLSAYGKKLKFHFVTRAYNNTNLRTKMLNIFKNNNYLLKVNHWGIDLYNDFDIKKLIEVFEIYINEIALVENKA